MLIYTYLEHLITYRHTPRACDNINHLWRQPIAKSTVLVRVDTLHVHTI